MKSIVNYATLLGALISTGTAFAEGRYVKHGQESASVMISYSGVDKVQFIADGSIHLESKDVHLFMPHAGVGTPLYSWDNIGLTIVNDGAAPNLNCSDPAIASVAGTAFTKVAGSATSANTGFPFVIILRPNYNPADVTLAQDGSLIVQRKAVQACQVQLPELQR